LTIEARLSVEDADDVRPKQKAFRSLRNASRNSLPALEGVVTRVSADSLVDERTGDSFYTAECRCRLRSL
jgi:HlyD family secretion protein